MFLNTKDELKILNECLSVHEKDREFLKKKLASLRVKIHRIKQKINNINQLEKDLGDNDE